jgi:hypothetical protein
MHRIQDSAAAARGTQGVINVSLEATVAQAELLASVACWLNLVVTLNVPVLFHLYVFEHGASQAPFWIRSIDEVLCIVSFLILAVFRHTHNLLFGVGQTSQSRLLLLLGGCLIMGAAMLALNKATAQYAYVMSKSLLLHLWVPMIFFGLSAESRRILVVGCGLIIIGSAIAQLIFSAILVSYWP